jgi:hypothetical protein
MDVGLEVDQKVYPLYFLSHPPRRYGFCHPLNDIHTLAVPYVTILSLGLAAGNSSVHLWSPQLDVRTQNRMELRP